MMSIKFKVSIAIITISILNVENLFSNSQETTQDVLDVQTTNLSYDFKVKINNLSKLAFELQRNMNFVVTEIEELKTLRQIVYHSHNHSAEELKDQQNSKLNILEVKCANGRLPENCYQVNECQNHIYNISIPNGEKVIPVSCDLKTEGSGWTVIQRRQDGSVSFFRNWTEYVEGFGDLNGEFFIGLEKLHVLTTQGGAQELYIILVDFEGARRYAKYKTFRVDSNETDYKLTVGSYSGNAGDSLSKHSGYKFSTWDRDNDGNSNTNCAESFHSGWWFNSCYYSNLNGEYLMGKIFTVKGLAWAKFRGLDYSLKYTQMMIRPRQD